MIWNDDKQKELITKHISIKDATENSRLCALQVIYFHINKAHPLASQH